MCAAFKGKLLEALVVSNGLIASLGCQSAELEKETANLKTLETLDAEWSAAAGAHDLEKTLSYYADGAYVLPPNEPMASDKAAIRRSWAGLLGIATAISWRPVTIHVYRGDLGVSSGYIVGTYAMTSKGAKGLDVADHGKFLEVWQEYAPGQWKCVADAFNSDLPATAQ
jgi:ketosteroid isomerase-like protein